MLLNMCLLLLVAVLVFGSDVLVTDGVLVGRGAALAVVSAAAAAVVGECR